MLRAHLTHRLTHLPWGNGCRKHAPRLLKGKFWETAGSQNFQAYSLRVHSTGVTLLVGPLLEHDIVKYISPPEGKLLRLKEALLLTS